MDAVMILLSTAVPVEELVENIRDAAQDAVLFPDDEKKMNHLMFCCTLFAMNRRTEGKMENAVSLIKDLESREAKLRLFEDTSIN